MSLVAALAMVTSLFLPDRALSLGSCAFTLLYSTLLLIRGQISLTDDELVVQGALRADRVPMREITRIDNDRFAMESAVFMLLPMLTTRIAVGDRLGTRFTPFFWHSGTTIVDELRRRVRDS